MVKKLLVTHPKHDPGMNYLFDFSSEAISTVRGLPGHHVTVLENADAIRAKFERKVARENPSMIFLNGHGTRKAVHGYQDEPILDKENVHLTENKIIYALSCDSLATLGKLAVKKGAKAYIGYMAEFMLVFDPTRVGNPARDRNALPFKEACVTLLNSLIYGCSAEEAVERTKEKYRSLIQSYGTSEDDPFGDSPLIRFALAWNLEFLSIEGEPSSCF